MAADGESTGKSKGRKDRADEADMTARRKGRASRCNELETIPTMVPREGDGYQVPRSGSVGTGARTYRRTGLRLDRG